MTSSPNKLSQFWQELKRRNVVRVITVYAGAAFVILELVDIIAEPLKLPSWLLPVAIVLLSIGFVIAVILSWIYDVDPEGGLTKTDPVDKVKPEEVSKSSSGWKIASYISFVVIVGLIILNIIPRANSNKKALEKSIAVLPFTNMSTDEENTYFIDGLMESILDNLCKIENLRVPGRTSVIHYRDNPKPISIVAEEMDVAYVLEGSGQKIGNRLLLTVQLIIGSEDRHIWSKQYDRVIEKVEDLIDIQKEIAELVAKEIEAIITPEEKQLIEKIPTANLTAHDFYLRGREEHWKFWMDRDNREALNMAEDQYIKAKELDSTYAKAYIGLSLVYWDKHYFDTYLSKSFMDSVLWLANIALSFDNQLSEAYVVRGNYYLENGQTEKAEKELDKAISINPNDWLAYNAKGWLFWQDDLVQSLDNFYKAAALNRGQSLPGMFRTIAEVYGQAGFDDKLILSAQQALELDEDSVANYLTISQPAINTGNCNIAIEYLTKAYDLDTNHIEIISQLASQYVMIDQEEEALKYIEKYLKRLESRGSFELRNMHRIAYIYWKNENPLKAKYYFDLAEEYFVAASKMGRWWASRYFTFYDLAGIYAFRGEKEKAYENLKIFNNKKTMPYWMVYLINEDPLFNNIRDEPEFQKIVRDVEAKYNAEHERVRQWLKENDML